MNSYIEKVKEFHESFNHPVSEVYNTDIELRKLRISLLFEELSELSTALDVNEHFENLCAAHTVCRCETSDKTDGDNIDHKGVIDAMLDLQYVLSGAAICLGYYRKFDDAFDEVHNSNMSKMCNNLKEVDETMSLYKEKGVETYYIEKNDKYIILRKADNKILKNKYYKEADLNRFI